jgi:hypothetical protein
MGDGAPDRTESLEGVRLALGGRLRIRGQEIAEAVYDRIRRTVPDPVEDLGEDYQMGVLEATATMVEYSLKRVEQGRDWSAPIPPAAAEQARRAARAGVSLGIVQRRYLAGHRCLAEFVEEELQRLDLPNPSLVLHELYKAQEAMLERLMAMLEYEYNNECRAASSPEQRRADIVRKLLADEYVDSVELAELGYKFHDRWHVALIVVGVDVSEAMRRLEIDRGRELIWVSGGPGMAWVWIELEQKLSTTEIERVLSTDEAVDMAGSGEPSQGMDGWRLTHYQAQEALGIALRTSEKLVRYEPFLAAAMQSGTAARSLKQTYLAPLANRRDGPLLRESLRAYIDAYGSATSAAKALNLDRHTVEKRLRTFEKLIGCGLYTCLAKVDVALRLDEFDRVQSAEEVRPAR